MEEQARATALAAGVVVAPAPWGLATMAMTAAPEGYLRLLMGVQEATEPVVKATVKRAALTVVVVALPVTPTIQIRVMVQTAL
ncbi:MAG: hypothetical protein DA408_11450 [Bacteroidetes bacterium]|nr:MAG: hypothetical protein C7N36_14940 [Bacteroidota bacterium]PTM12199.1 MAG: hypothetical protein DA408_11450 [Bacteroidota bacterium]